MGRTIKILDQANQSKFIVTTASLPLTVASSPSGCAIAWYAVGETQIGMLSF